MHEFSNYVVDEVIEIEELPLEECYMYDIGMKDTPHTFFANDILIHNSLFMPALPLIELDIDVSNVTDDELISRTLSITNTVQEFINNSYSPYAKKLHFIDSHRWHIKQELIGKRAFWGSAKKRYAIWVINKKGVNVDELEIKGFDVVRSSFPVSFRKFMKHVIEQILDGSTADTLNSQILQFKGRLNSLPITDILLPSGVKEISKFKNATKGIPIHVSSAMNYNSLLATKNLRSYPPISDGDKILYGYIRDNPYKFNTFAIRGYDDPPEFNQFIEQYADRQKIFENALISKLQTLWDSLGWRQIILNNNVNKFFN